MLHFYCTQRHDSHDSSFSHSSEDGEVKSLYTIEVPFLLEYRDVGYKMLNGGGGEGKTESVV